jgi:hypothetical protein
MNKVWLLLLLKGHDYRHARRRFSPEIHLYLWHFLLQSKWIQMYLRSYLENLLYYFILVYHLHILLDHFHRMWRKQRSRR